MDGASNNLEVININYLISVVLRVIFILALKLSLLNRDYILVNVFEGLGFNHFYVPSLCNAFIKDYIEIFYLIYEGEILSIQCKMSLRGHRYTCYVALARSTKKTHHNSSTV
jgi:hypothetical protein